VSGYVALVGGDEFKAGNEQQDTLLVQHRAAGTALVLPTAAARQQPQMAVRTAQAWFGSLGLDLAELPVLKRSDANSETNTELARTGGLFYLTGGDPGLVVDVLQHSRVWEAIRAAWRSGAALAGSSAGAMALGEWTLIRNRFPGEAQRRYKPALHLLPGIAVAPHFETFGHRWVEAALRDAPAPDVLIVGIAERSAAVWDGQQWTARGPGTLTLITTKQRTQYASGAVVPLPAPRTEAE
jgi:cyanophycinase